MKHSMFIAIVGTASIVAAAEAGVLGYAAFVRTASNGNVVIDVFTVVSNSSDRLLAVYDVNVTTTSSGSGLATFVQQAGIATRGFKPDAATSTRSNIVDSFMTIGVDGGAPYDGQFYASAGTGANGGFTGLFSGWVSLGNTVPVNAGWFLSPPTLPDNVAESMSGMTGTRTNSSAAAAGSNLGVWCAHMIMAPGSTSCWWAATAAVKDGATGATATNTASFNLGPLSPPPVDSDGDGIPNASDACPTVFGTCSNGCPPNVCGTCGPVDNDGDGVPNCQDNCPAIANPTQADCNGNGVGDACESFTDCNGNLRPDACDVVAGTSADIDANGKPDECQTVTVPGQYAGIQAAIDTAPTNEMRIISVAEGTYAGPIAFNGKPVIVRGVSAATTVIDGNGNQTVSVVRFTGAEPAIAALERFTIRGGNSGTPVPGSPTALAGGGIFGIDSAASVRDCVVEQNAGGFGGGMYFLRCSGEVRSTTIRNNNASSDGGGFQANQGTQRISDVIIENNTCNARGGGIHLVQGNPTLMHVIVRNNYSNNLAGGISWYALGSPTATTSLDLCEVTGNSALIAQGGIGISAPSTWTPSISLRSTNVCNNTPRPNVSGAWANLGNNTICDCVGDLTLDGVVNGADLGILLGGWFECQGGCVSDLNSDGIVNGADLGILLSAWGPCNP